MVEIAELLGPDDVHADLAVGSKRGLMTALGGAVERAWGLDGKLVADRLAAREKLGTTGFGGGIAIPHARLADVGRVRGLFARLTRPIDFSAVDDQPIDLVFLLLSPDDAGADHLKALARVSRRLRDRSLTAKLRGAGSTDALYALITEAKDNG